MPLDPVQKRKSRKDVGSQLLDQLNCWLAPELSARLEKERPWASITFSGTRYLFEIFSSDVENVSDKTQHLEQLSKHEFELPGWFVADVLIRKSGRTEDDFKVEILAIADPVSE